MSVLQQEQTKLRKGISEPLLIQYDRIASSLAQNRAGPRGWAALPLLPNAIASAILEPDSRRQAAQLRELRAPALLRSRPGHDPRRFLTGLTHQGMKRIAVDMDEVLADALSEHLARYNRDHGEAITKGQLEGKWLWDIVSADRHERLEGYLRSEDFFEDLPVVEDSQEVLAKLIEHYEIFIATAAMEFPNSFGPKYRWLRRHFPLCLARQLRLLRRQEHLVGRLLDRRYVPSLQAVQRAGHPVFRSPQRSGERISPGYRLAANRGVLPARRASLEPEICPALTPESRVLSAGV